MKIGILDDRQLARMLISAGIPMGFEFILYSPNPNPIRNMMTTAITGDYTDFIALEPFIEACDVITYENENIPAETVAHIEKFKPVRPPSQALLHSQDRLLEKKLF